MIDLTPPPSARNSRVADSPPTNSTSGMYRYTNIPALKEITTWPRGLPFHHNGQFHLPISICRYPLNRWDIQAHCWMLPIWGVVIWKALLLVKGCTAVLRMQQSQWTMMERDCQCMLAPGYSNRLVFNTANGLECFRGLKDKYGWISWKSEGPWCWFPWTCPIAAPYLVYV